jgi:hypothetical protein
VPLQLKVTDARKSIKNVINLDTHIQIKMDFINPESAEKYVEKVGMKKTNVLYLVYFNKEENRKTPVSPFSLKPQSHLSN